MKKFLFMKILPAVGLLFAASCSDDADDVRIDEKETPALNASFSADLEGKIWQETNLEQRMWMTNDGKLVDDPALTDISGGEYDYAYYFADGKATVFQRQTFGPAVYPVARRMMYTYTVDLFSGTISFAKLDGQNASNLPPFEIEKITGSELIIHDHRVYEGFQYLRCVLTPVSEAEAQQWWDDYVDMDQ